MRRLFLIALGGCWIALYGSVAAAQYYPPQRTVGSPRPLSRVTRPVTSPYLFLLQGNRNISGGLAFDYYRQVRPEIEWRRQNAAQFRSLDELQTEVDEQQELIQSPTSQLRPTGHATSFMNYGGYFPGRR